MTTTEYLTEYYNKFNEDKRLLSRHGAIEYINTRRFIDKYIARLNKDAGDIKILDIGAGTGAYAGPLSSEGYNVSAIELVKHNVSRLKQRYPLVDARQGNALNLKKYEDNSFDIVLLFGPMYHLFSKEDKVKALNEAIRVARKGAYIFVAYVMNEYSMVTYAFKEHHYSECNDNNRISKDYRTINEPQDLYDYVRIEDIDDINNSCNINRATIFSPDGPANYMRQELKEMSEEEYQGFVDYQYAISERMDLIGAGAHTVDVLIKAD